MRPASRLNKRWARAGRSYVYDFGDNWRHKVKVEKTVTLDAPLSLALCLAGENACPPEDVGGAPGYEDFLEALAQPTRSTMSSSNGSAAR